MTGWTGFVVVEKGPFDHEIKATIKKIYFHEKESLLNIKDLSLLLINDARQRNFSNTDKQVKEIETDASELKGLLESEFDEDPDSEELTGSVSEELIGSVSEELTGSVSEELTGSVSEELIGSVSEELTGSVSEELTGSVSEELTGSVSERHLTQESLQQHEEDGSIY